MSCPGTTPALPVGPFALVAALGLTMSASSCGLRAPDACMASGGTVILAGNVLRPPFVVEVMDSVLCVNGLWPARVESRVVVPDPVVFAHAVLMHEVHREASSRQSSEPDSVVIERAMARLRASPLVDSVKAGGFGDFLLWWRGQRYPDHVSVVEHHHPGHRPSPVRPAWRHQASFRPPAREEHARARARGICAVLQGGGVAIIGGGHVMTFYRDDTEGLMGEIDRVRRGLPGGTRLPEAVRAELLHPARLEPVRR